MAEKHQWDYIGNFRIGKELTATANPLFAVWICPKCQKLMKIKINGELYHV